MRIASVCIALFGLLLLGGCGGGGGGSSSSSGTDSPTFGGATAIEAVSTSTESIGIVDDSGTATAVIVFEIRDAADVLVPDGRRVDFALVLQPNGGEALSVSEAYTANGQVTVELRSGTTSGPVDLQASYYDLETGQTFTTVVRVTIIGGISDANHLSIAAEYLSLDAGILGLESNISAYVGDRYGNVIPDGTPVSFMTEGGTIGLSTGFDTTTTSGVASATLRTANPFPSDGLSKVVAYTSGSESYQDNDGDGVYTDEVHDTFLTDTDMSEPYIDANNNGFYETGELFIDSNGDGEFTLKNGVFDAKTTIWIGMNILFSHDIMSLMLAPDSGWTIAADSSQQFSFNFADVYDNALLGGATYKIETTVGTITGAETDFTLPDTNGSGSVVSFTLNVPTDAVANDQIEVKVTVALPDGAQGGNGTTLIDYSSGTVE